MSMSKAVSEYSVSAQERFASKKAVPVPGPLNVLLQLDWSLADR